MALLATDQNDFTLFKMMHIDELIKMLYGYIEKKPEHTEYYQSFVAHLLELKKVYESQLIRTEDNTIVEGDSKCLPH